MIIVTFKMRFALGQIVTTPGVLESIPLEEIRMALKRHARGDWGELCEEDRAQNELAIEQGFRLLSRYRTVGGTVFWIITEADRSATTVVLPQEY